MMVVGGFWDSWVTVEQLWYNRCEINFETVEELRRERSGYNTQTASGSWESGVDSHLSYIDCITEVQQFQTNLIIIAYWLLSYYITVVQWLFNCITIVVRGLCNYYTTVMNKLSIYSIPVLHIAFHWRECSKF